MRVMAMAALVLGVASGCSKRGAETDEEVRPAAFAAWMPARAHSAWQGAWTTRLTLRTGIATTIAGDPAALAIDGTTARAFDGTTEHRLGFSVIAPCEAQFAQAIDDDTMKGTAYYGIQYVLERKPVEGRVRSTPGGSAEDDRGTLVAGHGAAGYRRGRAAIVCARGIHVLEANGTCTTWELLATWRQRPERCVWSVEEGKDVLTIGTGDWAFEVSADGDLLTDAAFRQHAEGGHHRRAVDYASAMRAVKAQVAAAAR